ncbi:MAG: mechanosensitive ion channel, partial [Myxococcales bacterium]|nr:mechanosensitive ion channel [Myxococcales bacterium]
MSTAEYIVGAIGDLAAWVLGGLLLFWLLRLAVLLVGMSPLPPRAKASMLRLAPVVELLVAVAYVAAALVVLLTEEPEFAWVLIALVVALVAFSWSALHDLVLGVAFRVARVCQVGDLVQVDDITGRVLEVGLRALVLQTRDGDEAVVPYGRIGRRTLRRTQSVSGAYVHSFVLQPPGDLGFAELKRRVIEAAMRCHWA